jgi:hypothetical protein
VKCPFSFPERHVSGRFGLMAAGRLGKYPSSPVLLGAGRSFGPPAGVPLRGPYMRETVIIAAACFLIGIMAAALIVHFLVP